MAKVCPTCQGKQAGCPTCNAPPKRVLPKADVYKRKIKRDIRYGAVAWEVQGIDISRWNGNMNFAITKTKCQYVFIRLGYGNGWKDMSSDSFYQGARAQDMPVGVYWFCNIGEDPIAHADGFYEEILTHNPQIDIVLDAERTTLGPQATLDWLKAVDGRVRSKTGKVPMIYTSMGFWNTGVARSSYWAGRTLWVANWTTRDYPTMPYDFTTWNHWQWSADGNMKAAEYGSSNGDPDMDLDRFNGTVSQFNIKYGTHIAPIGPPPPPPPPGTLPPYVLIGSPLHPITELSIHSAPALSSPTIGHALKDTKWYPLEEVQGDGIAWYRIAKDAYFSKSYTRYP